MGVWLGEDKRHDEQIRQRIVFLLHGLSIAPKGGTTENVEPGDFLNVLFQNLPGRTEVKHGRRLCA